MTDRDDALLPCEHLFSIERAPDGSFFAVRNHNPRFAFKDESAEGAAQTAVKALQFHGNRPPATEAPADANFGEAILVAPVDPEIVCPCDECQREAPADDALVMRVGWSIKDSVQPHEPMTQDVRDRAAREAIAIAQAPLIAQLAERDATIQLMRTALEKVANRYDESYSPMCEERMLGDACRAALTAPT